MRTTLALVIVITVIVVECGTLFVLFVPIVPETATAPCYTPACNMPILIFNYYGSVSFHYFNVGMVYGACNGFQMVTSASRSPNFCLSLS